jgi:hypothetical protein
MKGETIHKTIQKARNTQSSKQVYKTRKQKKKNSYSQAVIQCNGPSSDTSEFVTYFVYSYVPLNCRIILNDDFKGYTRQFFFVCLSGGWHESNNYEVKCEELEGC